MASVAIRVSVTKPTRSKNITLLQEMILFMFWQEKYFLFDEERLYDFPLTKDGKLTNIFFHFEYFFVNYVINIFFILVLE